MYPHSLSILFAFRRVLLGLLSCRDLCLWKPEGLQNPQGVCAVHGSDFATLVRGADLPPLREP